MDAALQQRVVIRLWGDFRVLDGAGAPIEITSKKARACLALLATAAEATLSRDRLAAMLWGDRTDAQARANLRQMLYELKPLVQASAPILGFDRHDAWFESACDLDTDALQRYDAAELAASLPGRGEIYLADLDGVSAEFDDWLAPERASAEATLKRNVQLRVEESLALGDFSAVRALADAWAARDATDETIARLGLRADAALGDGARIAQRMHRLEAALATELGVRPSAATTALARELSMQMHSPPTQAAARSPGQGPLPSAPSRSRSGARRPGFAAAAVLAITSLLFAIWQIIEYRSAPSVAFSEAEHLTTNARELSHGRTRAGYSQAAALARRAIAADPTYAPAWAELAMASYMPALWEETRHPGSEAKLRAEVLGYLDRAVELHPRLGRALAIRGMILGGTQATPLLERAVIEAPDDAEAWLWLCNQRGQSGFFHEANDACRRAAELAPLWDRSVAGYVTSATEAGEDAAAVDRVLDRFEAVTPNRFTAESLRAGAAAARGNLLAAARHGSLALTLAPDDPWIQIFELALVARAAGDLEAVRRLTSGHAELKTRFAPVFDPDGAVARAQNAQTWWTSAFVEDEARHLLRAGRADLLLGLLEQQPLPLLELYRGRTWYGAPLGAQLVVALRGAGRDEEANSLTQAIRHDLDQMAARRYSHFNLDLANAIAFALDARGDDAVVSLERAVAKGWRGQTSDWAVDPADEPAFAGLRGRADFERVRARMAGEIDRVRVEIAEILAQTPIPKVKTIVADDS